MYPGLQTIALRRPVILYGLKISVSKFFCLHIGRRNAKRAYSINGDVIPTTEAVPDLGLQVDSKLNFSAHVDSIIISAHRKCYLLMKTLRSTSLRVYVTAHKYYIRPILEYATECWNSCTGGLSLRVERVQKHFTRWIYRRCRLPYASYADRLRHLEMETLCHRRRLADLIMLSASHISQSFCMDSLPHCFYDSVFWYLHTEEMKDAKCLTGTVANIATHHFTQRRDLQVTICPDFEENLCGIGLLNLGQNRRHSLKNALSKYDRIVTIVLDHGENTAKYESFSFETALTKVLPSLLSLSPVDLFWAFGARSPHSGSFYDDLFKLFGSQVFKMIRTKNYGDQCEQFVRVQTQSPRLEHLYLHDDLWPQDFKFYYRDFHPKFIKCTLTFE
ncbi:hypothetical protein QR680_004349 [Steinernema hermaphroditum]|uniref:Uncharacterized protein n=1 Tax=Steinernema hermaphroditum TaxID=289476 RepID=A0AA39HNG2_9BILA|nr:hypothetical protein QR680_004349 [Steinernema hermaphroditum]